MVKRLFFFLYRLVIEQLSSFRMNGNKNIAVLTEFCRTFILVGDSAHHKNYDCNLVSREKYQYWLQFKLTNSFGCLPSRKNTQVHFKQKILSWKYLWRTKHIDFACTWQQWKYKATRSRQSNMITTSFGWNEISVLKIFSNWKATLRYHLVKTVIAVLVRKAKLYALFDPNPILQPAGEQV